MAILFDGKAKFAMFEGEAASQIANDNNIDLNALFIYTNGFLMGCYPYPSTDSPILYLLDLILNGEGNVVQNMTALCKEIGPGPFTIFSPVSKINDAKFLQYRIGSQMGPVHVVPVNNMVLNNLGIKEDSLALFRREDLYSVPIKFDLNEVYLASYPVFRNLGSKDLMEPDKIIFALIANKLTDEYSDFLFEVGLRHKNFIVGFVPTKSEFIPSISTTSQKVFPLDKPSIAVFNIDKNIHYDTHDFFGELENLPFLYSKWLSATNKMLNQIEEKKIQPSFISEEEPEVDPNSNFVKVVGTTYEKFINDPNHDIVVLFKRENCEHCQSFFKVLESFSEECAKANVNTIKFGYIDIHKNSAKIRFPYISGVPHIHIFPAKNKTDNDSLRGGHNRDGLIRFIKRYGSYDIPFEPGPINQGEVAMEVLQLLFTAKEMPQEEQIKALKYIEDMSKYISKTPNETNKTYAINFDEL